MTKNNIILTLTLLLFVNSGVSAEKKQASLQSNPLTIGEQLAFHSAILNEKRLINVYLPPTYSQKKEKAFPVIYLLDGSLDEDMIHISGLVQFGSFSWIKMLPESIVVGIGNVDRKRDFTFPTKNEKDKAEFPTTGGSAQFFKFISNELQPLVDSRYRTNGSRMLIGQSLGGLLATEILFRQPSLFSHYVIVSPSLWWDDESLLANPIVKNISDKGVFIAVGEEGPTMVRTAKKLYKKLESNKSKPNRLGFKYLPEQSHGDALHLAVYAAFEELFRSQSGTVNQ